MDRIDLKTIEYLLPSHFTDEGMMKTMFPQLVGGELDCRPGLLVPGPVPSPTLSFLEHTTTQCCIVL